MLRAKISVEPAPAPNIGSSPRPEPIAAPEDISLEILVEALLFVADGPITPGEMREATGANESEIERALQSLRTHYASRGIRIIVHGDSYQMCSAPEASRSCRSLLGLNSNQKLTQASLETLAIIAYNQPTTRAQIEHIRGVNSDSPLSLLANRGLIAHVGRGDQMGRPILYATTAGFLAYFGIESLGDLPEADLPTPVSGGYG